MFSDLIPEPFQFNPMKHHLDFIRDFILENENASPTPKLIRLIRHIGTSVMDIYTGDLGINDILTEVHTELKTHSFSSHDEFSMFTGKSNSNFRIITLSDGSEWTLKYHESLTRYIHLFPARSSPHSIRVKANTLKSAILFIIIFGKDYITEDDLNGARSMISLSPIREVAETAGISAMIEILRNR